MEHTASAALGDARPNGQEGERLLDEERVARAMDGRRLDRAAHPIELQTNHVALAPARELLLPRLDHPPDRVLIVVGHPGEAKSELTHIGAAVRRPHHLAVGVHARTIVGRLEPASKLGADVGQDRRAHRESPDTQVDPVRRERLVVAGWRQVDEHLRQGHSGLIGVASFAGSLHRLSVSPVPSLRNDGSGID